jgi:predicted N-formylglutamate amidohydrolase
MRDAFERIAARRAAPILVSCEHAAEALPKRWRWPEEDGWLAGSHWAFDLGAAELARALADAMGAEALLARFSRLLIDPNRPPGAPTLIREEAEGRAIALNRALDQEERTERMRYWSAYHDAFADAAARTRASVLFAIHTFTPDYPGERREHIEVGVLFDADEALGMRLARHLALAGLLVRLNEPYSGKEGLIYAADRHARATERQAVEIELRQDRAVDPSFRRRLVRELTRFPWAG